MALGQAAGLAVVWAIRDRFGLDAVDGRQLRNTLQMHGAKLAEDVRVVRQ